MVKRIVLIENNVLATNTIRKELTMTLNEKGFNVIVLTTGTKEELDFARCNGVEIYDIKSSNKNVLEIINYIQNLKRALKKLKPDLCLTFTIRPNIWGNLISNSLKIPVISNITGIGPLFENSSFPYKIARILYKLSLRRTKIVFFQNEDDESLFLKKNFVSKENARLIPGSGVDTSLFTPQEKTNNEYFSFLFIGRLIRDKGILEYVEASKIVRAQFPKTEFKVVGPIWKQNLKDNTITKAQIEEWSSKKIITYEGSTNDVRPFIAEADCVVIPSYREGMSNVLLEAGSMETPCIGTYVPGCKEIIENNVTGLLCKPKDSVDLAEKMIKMLTLNETSRRLMGKKARKKIQSQFEKDIVIKAYLKEIDIIS